MRLSQMVNNVTDNSIEDVKSKDVVNNVIDSIMNDKNTTNKNRPEGHLQSQLTDGERGTAADISEDELEFIKQMGNPGLVPTPAEKQHYEMDEETKAHMNNIKDLIS